MPDLSGQQFGSYHLVRLLGRGGFAEVYLAEHLHLKTEAAIKILHTSLQSDGAAVFLQEAQTLAHLKHPHIVRVFDFALEDSIPFLVMDYLPHGNLSQHHHKGESLPLDTVISYTLQIASALQYAHDQRVIHRDIKPENMLFDQQHNVILSDFGIALMSQTSRAQSTQEVAGTAAYMAPEQFRGKPRRASDQYALGVVVYEWLSGERPFVGIFSEVASQHMFVAPPPLSNKAPTLPASIEMVVLKALAKNPDERFPSVQSFATALQQAAQGMGPMAILNPLSQSPLPASLASPVLTVGSNATASSSEFVDMHPPSLSPPKVILPSSGATSTSIKFPATPQSAFRPDSSTATSNQAPSSSAFAIPIGQSNQPYLPLQPAINFQAASADNPVTPRPPGHTIRNVALLVVIFLVIIAGALYFVRASGSQVKTPYAPKTVLTATVQTQQTVPAVATQSGASLPGALLKNPYPPYSGKMVLNDPLSSNKAGYGWKEFSETIGGGYASAGQKDSCQFANSAYDYTIPAHYGGECLASATDFSNFAYEVTMKFVKAAPNWSGGGIVFRASGSNYYELEIFESGRYSLDVCSGNSCAIDLTNGKGITPQGAIAGFHAGLNQTNTVAVVANSYTLDLYVNNQHIFGPVGDDTYTHGQIGVYAEGGFDVNNGNAQPTETELIYSNAKVWQL